MLNQIYAIKQRMSQEFWQGRRTPVTSLLVPAHQIISEKSLDKDGYRSLVIALGQTKKMTKKKSLLGLLKSKEINFTPKKIKEIRLMSDEAVEGNILAIEKIVTPNSKVTVIGESKGKGFAGVVKRWGFNTQPRTHGQSDRHRAPGSIARGTTPGRVLPGKKMPGRLGGERVSTKNLKVLSYDPATGILKIKGAIPGAPNAFVTIKVTQLAEVKE